MQRPCPLLDAEMPPSVDSVSPQQADFGDDSGLHHKKIATMPPPTSSAPAAAFSPYQKFVVGLLALLQFAVILDLDRKSTRLNSSH